VPRRRPKEGNLPVGAPDRNLLPAKVEVRENICTYTLTIPWAVFGRKEPVPGGFRLSFLINDNDGDGRRQWVELSPGIGKQKEPALFPLFICK